MKDDTIVSQFDVFITGILTTILYIEHNTISQYLSLLSKGAYANVLGLKIIEVKMVLLKQQTQ